MMKKIVFLFSLMLANNSFSQDSYYDYQPIKSSDTQPYFKVLTKGTDIDRIPLLLTTVDAEINGFMAEVKVTQYYKNDGSVPLEAQYVFPGSTDAAVHQVEMVVGDRRIIADIQKKKEAKETYLKAKEAGKTTSLLEQSDPGLFTMNLANILPGDDIQVSLSYTEKIIPSQGKYTFTYPAIGRPSVLARGNTAPQSYAPGKNSGFDLSVVINSPHQIAGIISKNHLVEIEYQSDKSANILLDESEQLEFNQDFIFEYDLREQAVDSGLLLHQDEESGYFLLTVQPPAAFKTTEIIPREYVFVVDSSGSMTGTPIENAKYITQSLMSDLAPEEFFNVVLFAGGSKVFSQTPQQVNQADIKKAMKMVSVSSAGGGTDLFSALKSINDIPRVEGVSRTLVIMTDGAISVPDHTIDLLLETPDQNVFVIGVSGGYSNDVATIKALALAGQGQPFFISDDEEDIAKIQEQFLDYVRYPLLSNINIEAIGFEGLDIQPTHVVDLFAQRPVFITGKFDGTQRGSLRITGDGNGLKYDEFFDLDGIADQDNQSIRYLWAREKINRLSLNQNTNENEITSLGLEYHLMTPFTSFVAVDQIVRNEGGVEKVTQQPSVSGYGFAENDFRIELNRKFFELPMIPKPITPSLVQLDQRQNITFIMGQDKSSDNLFYQLATDLFNNHPDHKTTQVVHLDDLAQIKSYLETHQGDMPWGVVNVVAHSSPWSGIQQDHSESVGSTLNYFNVNNLLNETKQSPLSDQIIDGHSEIRLIGCAIGGQKNLLNALSQYFGGNDQQRPQVKAPNDYVFLRNEFSQLALYGLENPWFLSHEKAVSNDLEFIKQIRAHAPESKYISSQHWTLSPVEISLPVDWMTELSEEALKIVLSQQLELIRYLDDLSASIDDFKWRIDVSNQSNPVLIGSSVLVKFKLPEGDISHLLENLDFDNPDMMSSSH
ncbi:VIT and VWA domain-containing protein [Marinicella sp. S1101]|uniref:VIT and vWA domain-containing protein n=1 Tax=Marinicella marina TaxID=2996016 RepID=UPI002260C54A|nr:VIT and VWA domain-containing protein [Marinicella marina]MCX7554874.1 VIT and VWA domain-containing protein [Marinicella marina]MDJ1141532.1 VIT and VWA domain-containing protein [Marinicella marina]